MLAENTAPFTGEMWRVIGTAAEAVNSGFIGECSSFSVSASQRFHSADCLFSLPFVGRRSSAIAAAGTSHCITPGGSLYTVGVEDELLVDWLTS